MLVARTTTGSSTHGNLYELDAIAAVVIGGTLLTGGRGTIVGTVLGVLIFTTLTNIFILNNRSISEQAAPQGSHHRRRRAAPAAVGVSEQQYLAPRRTARTSSIAAHTSAPHLCIKEQHDEVPASPSRRSWRPAWSPVSPSSPSRPAPATTPATTTRPTSAAARPQADSGLQRRGGRQGRHRLLGPRGRPRLDGLDHPVRQGRRRAVRRHRPARRRGHQRRQPADQPGRDVHQRRASTRSCCCPSTALR